MPFICKIRTDIPDSILQVLDLQPNESQRNLIYEPRGQNKYVNRVTNDTLLALAANATTAQFEGLAAYLIDHVIDAVSGVTITVAVANASAVALIATLDSGADCDVAAINAALIAGGAGVGTTLTAGGSTGVVTDVLKILAGGEYILPAGSLVGALAAPAELGSFTAGQYLQTRQTGALEISLGDGHLAEFTDAAYEYAGTAGAALVVLDDDGTVKTAVV